MTFSILVVCTGNICRSPMAEGLLNGSLPPALKATVTVASAGTHARNGLSAEAHAVDVLLKRNIDIQPHRSRQLDTDMVAAADLILVMEQIHAGFIINHWPSAETKVRMLGDFSFRKTIAEIPDPYGGSPVDYRTSAELIRACLNGLIIHLHEMLLT